MNLWINQQRSPIWPFWAELTRQNCRIGQSKVFFNILNSHLYLLKYFKFAVAIKANIKLKIAARADPNDYWLKKIKPLVEEHKNLVEFLGELNDEQKKLGPL
jgi:RNase adaptor protein for sRNA GlmZ degradation